MPSENHVDVANSVNPTRADTQSVQTYRIQVLTTRDDEGVYSTIALNLPGAGSCGETQDESIANATDAIIAVLEAYKETGSSIPWQEVTDDQLVEGELKVIFVHA